jgi:hypothetical protein
MPLGIKIYVHVCSNCISDDDDTDYFPSVDRCDAVAVMALGTIIQGDSKLLSEFPFIGH